MKQQQAIIIGAGPAGLTAAYELATRTAIKPIVLEQSDSMGGIARTVQYHGNRIDIGGHRFFSKSDRVMNWWLNILPLQKLSGDTHEIRYHGKRRAVSGGNEGPDPEKEDRVMLVRSRTSRIYFSRKFFEYPIRLSFDTMKKLGFMKLVRIGMSYMRSVLFPVRPEKNLEDFFINRFGRELYNTFFKSYTEKVWGVPCTEIDPSWGAQRIKGLSIWKTIVHMLRTPFRRRGDVAQKKSETSLIEEFLYPKFGPGQMWEVAAERVREHGGEILARHEVRHIHAEGSRIVSVTAYDHASKTEKTFTGDYFFSTMAIKDFVNALDVPVPESVREVSEGLQYRDFITVGLLLDELKISEEGRGLIRDNWIYVQEPDVLVGRLQIFNNWSPALVRDPGTVWIGLEYFCYEHDELWKKSDTDMIAFATAELAKIGIIEPKKVRDATVMRMQKTYPAYFGTYNHFTRVREFLDSYTNLFPVGRNGMHKYNNQDHSMLTAMTAVDNIIAGKKDKKNIWDVNTEEDYHEEKHVSS